MTEHAGTVPVTAIVTAFNRIDQALTALRAIRACRPAPAEVLVHVDGGQQACAQAIEASGLANGVLVTDGSIGPGGGRNKLIAAASHDLVASFDDDSWPMDSDYFGRLVAVAAEYPSASIIAAAVIERGQVRTPGTGRLVWSADFAGGGCAYRKAAFLATGGYVPLPVAYFMEEVDLALRLHEQGGKILLCDDLRVEHDSTLEHHASARVTAASVANIALLTFLRYPVAFYPVGAAQVLRRTWWLLTHGRRAGVVRGLASIPSHLASHRSFRRPVAASTVRSFLQLRRMRVPAH